MVSPRRLLDSDRQRVDALAGRMSFSMSRALERRRGRWAVAAGSLATVSPLATLARGFAIVRDTDGALIRSTSQAQPGAAVTVQVSDGVFGARVEG